MSNGYYQPEKQRLAWFGYRVKPFQEAGRTSQAPFPWPRIQNDTKRPGLRRLTWTRITASQVFVWLMFGVLLFGESRGVASPAAYPERRINGHIVNLMPLILWWEDPRGNRPLGSWKHIQGILEREIGSAWMIRGKAEGETGAQLILLKNPPQDRLRRCSELQDLLPKLEQSRASSQEIASLPSYSGWHWEAYGLARTPTADFDRVDHAKASLQEIDRRINEVKEELAILADKHGNLKIDAFALRMTGNYEAKPIFDFGYSP